ncbi:mechanosensitive ion channel protein MscS [Tamlana sedimentorum]|uniref:Mechanosensitive ion channel protein MscS n=2 Tax=Neotamlana TaxID=3400367 RepID=A0A0D7WA84_9FLAO|nr:MULTISPECIES: mechanosensitive ion channel family protein [Tamlana]KJD36071.1 mechanosensitive ion channel protein MscS [Tamlana sedimentorum]MCB4797678.1 mechanosensitive ion channel family protein [Tamlana laminarinivorans]
MESTITEAFNNLITKLQGWLNAVIQNIPNLILAIVVMVASYFIATYIKKLVLKLVSHKVKQQSIANMIAKISAVVIVMAGLFLSLGILNLSKMLTSLLAGAGVAGLAIGLALQGTLSNTFAGIVISFRKRIQIGNWVETSGYSGEVIDVNLKEFVLKEADNHIVIIPNKTILENPLKNYSLANKMRVFINCGVGYESDLEQVKDLTQKTIANAFSDVKSAEDVEFYYTEFGDSSINYLCRFWINTSDLLEKKRVKTKAIIEIKKAYDKAGINIPFPIRTLEFNNKLSFDEAILDNQYSNN